MGFENESRSELARWVKETLGRISESYQKMERMDYLALRKDIEEAITGDVAISDFKMDTSNNPPDRLEEGKMLVGEFFAERAGEKLRVDFIFSTDT